jgi:16S rRNA processing protein RimM
VAERLVPLGNIVTTHGLDGWLKLNPYNPDTSVLSPMREIFLEKDGVPSTHHVESLRVHKGQFLIKLLGVDVIDEAEDWVGSTVSVAEDALQFLQPGEYYHYQVIGFEVVNVRGERVGIVTRTWSTPAGVLYIVAGKSKEHLIPAVKEIIDKVDLSAKRIIIDPPEGLLDL